LRENIWQLFAGVPNPLKDTINKNLSRDKKNRMIMSVPDEDSIGKRAVTHYKVVEDYGYVSLIECQLETGRTHQIRAHMKYIGHPIFNDIRYGGDKILKGTIFNKYKQFVENCFKVLPRQALHAKTLGFVHPIKNKKMVFEIEVPDDFNSCLEKWKKYSKNI
jgi:Pseudouridylate synthases, 23S RNA-specific